MTVIARAFVEALTGSPETPMRFRLTDDDKKRRLNAIELSGSVSECWARLMDAQGNGYCVSYFVNEVVPGLEGFARDSDITKIRAIPADFDQGLPHPWEWHLAPDMLVHTSVGRGHALWVCEPPIKDFKAICRRLIAYYNSDPAVQNPSHLLRLPGTMHQKNPLNPQLVTWERYG